MMFRRKELLLGGQTCETIQLVQSSAQAEFPTQKKTMRRIRQGVYTRRQNLEIGTGRVPIIRLPVVHTISLMSSINLPDAGNFSRLVSALSLSFLRTILQVRNHLSIQSAPIVIELRKELQTGTDAVILFQCSGGVMFCD